MSFTLTVSYLHSVFIAKTTSLLHLDTTCCTMYTSASFPYDIHKLRFRYRLRKRQLFQPIVRSLLVRERE